MVREVPSDRHVLEHDIAWVVQEDSPSTSTEPPFAIPYHRRWKAIVRHDPQMIPPAMSMKPLALVECGNHRLDTVNVGAPVARLSRCV
jgi:hypothetical protein